MEPGAVTRLWRGLLWVGLLATGFVVGRLSVRVDDQELRDSLAVYRDHRKADAKALDSSRAVILAAQDAAQRWEEEAARWNGLAAARVVAADRYRDRADSLARALATATTPEDSLRACIAEVTARRSECAEVRAANADLLTAAAADDSVKRALRQENAAHLGQRARDSTRLAEADGLVTKLEKNARGCRLPLVGFKCPAASATWDFKEPEILPRYFSATYPLKSWLHVGITWDRKKAAP
jgi:hypothetical protein